MSITNSIIFKNRFLLVSAIFCLLFIIIGFLTVYFKLPELASPLILHFDEVLGSDFFGGTESLWFLWITGFFVVFINLFLGYILFYRERVLSYLLFGITALFSLFHLISIVQIISLN